MKGGNFNPTPIDRVNKYISNIRLTYKCYYIVITLRTRPIHLTAFWVNIVYLFFSQFLDVDESFLDPIYQMKISESKQLNMNIFLRYTQNQAIDFPTFQ